MINNDKITDINGIKFKFEEKLDNFDENKAKKERLMTLVSNLVKDRVIETYKFNEVKMYYDLDDISLHPNKMHLDNTCYSRVYCSNGALKGANVLVLLIQGNGLQPLIWDNDQCINKDFKTGSMIEIIEKLTSNNYEVMCLNPNENTFINGSPNVNCSRESIQIPNHSTPELHTVTTFKELILPSSPRKIIIIACDYGASCVMSVLEALFPQLENKLKGIFLIQSIHSGEELYGSDFQDWFLMNCVNWVESNDPECATIESIKLGCPTFSIEKSSNCLISKLVPNILQFIQSKTN
ncbi:hypothetical protein CONCODRAFT_10186 [Conidiobolus coronatus NRRL 28638]|uniref:Arb2 domain-containing protein n=1 Tax=Conidiobolus coronatus (strain ATCC 28846 / CBS 209.66 / NRRL 28638) TaxID=796925 RepID=A0A137NYL5_CONC2|nr:hypothetical protein CONCODRAFT_10186 [Conidiobolus coronatus NRRL 28638]|eukprot:KXN67699.1 hypothetical protein CONCODRAFT_10186 [Conidiobolus coronatus NRRL 28638]